MIRKKMFLLFIVSMITIPASAMELETAPVNLPHLPEEIQLHVVEMSNNLRTHLMFGQTCTKYNKQSHDCDTILLKNPRIYFSLSSNEYHNLFKHYAAIGDEAMCVNLMMYENVNNKNNRESIGEFFQKNYPSFDWSVRSFMKIYNNDPLSSLSCQISSEALCRQAIYCKNEQAPLIILIKNGVDINCIDDFGMTLLIHAVTEKNMHAASLLLKKGCDVNTCDKLGNTALHYVHLLNKKVVRLLIDHQINVNIQNDMGDTALHCAVAEGRWDVAQLLIHEGNADITIKNARGRTAFYGVPVDEVNHILAVKSKDKKRKRTIVVVSTSRKKAKK